MLIIFLSIIIGIMIGYLFKSKKILFSVSNFLSTVSVYFLLFFMGISTAQKEELFLKFKEVGAISIILCISGMLGSVIALIPVNKYLNRHRKLLWSYLELKSNDKPDLNSKSDSKPVSIESQPEKIEKHLSSDMFYPLISFLLGFIISFFFFKEKAGWIDFSINWSLYLLIFFTGIGIGKLNIIDLIKKYHIFVVLIPITAMLGSILSGLFVSLLIQRIDSTQAMAVCSGMGYYSISAIICTQNLGEIVGIIALFANLLRELLTILFAPVLVKLFGHLAPIGTGGATAMDTTLPFIKKSAGNEYAIVGFISGVILTVIVPVVTSVFN
jgi:uncharacterized membrane protein YbjE (DUF340 family)